MKVGKDKLIKFVLFRENDCSALELYLEEMTTDDLLVTGKIESIDFETITDEE